MALFSRFHWSNVASIIVRIISTGDSFLNGSTGDSIRIISRFLSGYYQDSNAEIKKSLKLKKIKISWKSYDDWKKPEEEKW